MFVLIWSTGFVVARCAMPHSPPRSFLSLRCLLSIVAFGIWITIDEALTTSMILGMLLTVAGVALVVRSARF